MVTTQLLGILAALTAAGGFGAGDFSGGLAARRSHQYQVVFISTVASLALLLAFTLLWRESLPAPATVVWAVLAGVAGSLGLAAFYRALAIGQAAIVAPTTGVIGAALPVLVGTLIQGASEPAQYAGFALAFGGIWLVTRTTPGTSDASRTGLGLAVGAGLAFGGFFIFIDRIESAYVFAPLMVAKLVSVLVALVLLRGSRQEVPGIRSNPAALLAGALDASANIFYLVATNLTRLDIAAVLASLYPAITVFLSRGILNEQISRSQWMGVALCLGAIALIVY